MLTDPCPCGRTLPLLSFPQGRSSDWIQLSSGKMIHPQSVADIFDEMDGIWQFQVVQESHTHFCASVVTSPNCDREAVSKVITHNFKQTLGEDIAVNLIFVDQIERTASGKLRPIISKLQGRESHAS